MTGDDSLLADNFVTLVRFLGDTNLTARLSEIEFALVDQDAEGTAGLVDERGFSDELSAPPSPCALTSDASTT